MLQMALLILGRQEKGAIVNGRMVQKRNSEENDRTPEGTKGEILGSIAMPNLEPAIVAGTAIVYGYLVKFPTDPIPIFTTDHKLEEV